MARQRFFFCRRSTSTSVDNVEYSWAVTVALCEQEADPQAYTSYNSYQTFTVEVFWVGQTKDSDPETGVDNIVLCGGGILPPGKSLGEPPKTASFFVQIFLGGAHMGAHTSTQRQMRARHPCFDRNNSKTAAGGLDSRVPKSIYAYIPLNPVY